MCKLGNEEVNDTECSIDKPSVVQDCDEIIPCPPSCLPASNCVNIVDSYCKVTIQRIQLLLEPLCRDNCCKCDCAK